MPWLWLTLIYKSSVVYKPHIIINDRIVVMFENQKNTFTFTY